MTNTNNSSDISSENSQADNQTEDIFGLNRRNFMRGAAVGAGAMLMQPTDLFAATEAKEKEKVNQSVSEHARSTTLPKEAFDLPRWMPEKRGNYDLNDPTDNHLSFAKVQANLAGEYSWLAQYGWIVMAPPGKPAYPLLGRLTAVKVFLTEADKTLAKDVGDDDYLMWGTFTTTHVDPRTFEPVDSVMNPYTGKQIDVPTIHYADRLLYRKSKSIIVPGVDPKFYDQPWDRDGGYSQHFIDAGGDISYTVLGASQQDGIHQPRCDVGFWTVKRDELMNPKMPSINTRRDYSVIQKASEYAWYGVEKGDDAQLLVHLTGQKAHSRKELPSFINSLVIDRFPERFK